jgi:hypothetical protein
MPIFDQGYQHWRGSLSGHAWRWLAIARHGVRVQMKNRILRFLVLVAWLPAIALVVTLAGWGLVEQQSEGVLKLARSFLPPNVLQDASSYRAPVWALSFSFFFKMEMFFIFLLVVVAGPGLISRDLRFNALPLYFSRPLTRLDYFLGKLGVIGALVAAVAVGPAVFAYVVGACFCLDLSIVKDTYPALLASVAYGLVVTVSTGTLMLALSSLTRRSLYVGIAFAGLWIISASVGSIMTAIHRETISRAIREEEVARWVAEHPPPPGIDVQAGYPRRVPLMKGNNTEKQDDLPAQDQRANDWQAAWQQTNREAWLKGRMDQGAMVRDDWRPLCSYNANLERMADLLFDTDGAWVTFGRAIEGSRAAVGGAFGGLGGRRRGPGFDMAPGNERRLADQMVLQYPWQWSAGVLAALLGLSTWILTRRVKTLDQLK